MTRPEELSVAKLYEHVVNESQSLLEQTLNFLESCALYCEQFPDKAAQIRALADPIVAIYDVRKKGDYTLTTSKQLTALGVYLPSWYSRSELR